MSVLVTSYVEAMSTIRRAFSGICVLLFFIRQAASYVRTFLTDRVGGEMNVLTAAGAYWTDVAAQITAWGQVGEKVG